MEHKPEGIIMAETGGRARKPGSIPSIGQVPGGTGKRPGQDRPGLAGPLDQCRDGSFFRDGTPRALPSGSPFWIHHVSCFLGLDLGVVASSI